MHAKSEVIQLIFIALRYNEVGQNCSRYNFVRDFEAYLLCIIELNKRTVDHYNIMPLLTEMSSCSGSTCCAVIPRPGSSSVTQLFKNSYVLTSV